MYNCSRCGKTTKAGQPRLTKTTFKEYQDPTTGRVRKDIAKEEPLCPDCHREAVPTAISNERP